MAKMLPRLLRHAAALAIALIAVAPLAWMVTTSLRQTGQPLPRKLEWLPEPIAWENYARVFDTIQFGRFALNSALVTLCAVPLTLITASLAGFALAQVTPRWRLRLTALSFVALMVPLTAVWLPRFILFREAGLIDRRLALIIPAFGGTSPFYVLIFLWAFMRVPRECFEAARVDGAGHWRVWAGIGLPLARPAVVAVATLAGVHYLSSYIEPLLYLRSLDRFTLTLGLQALLQMARSDWPLLMAGAVMITMPVVVLFLIAQQAFFDPNRGSGWIGR